MPSSKVIDTCICRRGLVVWNVCRIDITPLAIHIGSPSQTTRTWLKIRFLFTYIIPSLSKLYPSLMSFYPLPVDSLMCVCPMWWYIRPHNIHGHLVKPCLLGFHLYFLLRVRSIPRLITSFISLLQCLVCFINLSMCRNHWRFPGCPHCTVWPLSIFPSTSLSTICNYIGYLI